MNLFIAIAGILGLVTGGGVGSVFFLNQQENIRNELTSLQESHVKLDQERDSLLNEKIGLNAALKSLEGSINKVEDENSSLKVEIADLKNNISTLTASKKFFEDLVQRLWNSSCDSVFAGGVWERSASGGIGNEISGANITYKLEGTNLTKNVVSSNGRYTVTLPIDGRFVVAASHQDYQPYSSLPGFFVAKKCGTQTANIFLER